MKKLILAIVALFTLTIPANAMSYEQARQQALFLADKMAYELNLTEAQYEAVYEINLDYLMSINNYDDLYGVYWRQRNMDLSYILLDWQYRAYCAASYFYRPLYWDSGYWHFAIYARYPHRSYLYFGRPTFWTVYRGGHSWRMNGGRSWYHGRNLRPHHSSHHSGMRDHFDRNKHNRDFGQNNRPGNQNFGNRNDHKRNHDGFGNNNRNRDNNRGFGKDNNQDHKRNHDGFGNSRDRDNNRGQNNRTFGNGSDRGQNNGFGRPNSPSTRESSTRTTVTNSDNRRFNGTRGGDVQSRPSTHRERPTTTTPSSSSRNSFGGSSHSSGSRSSFGGGSHSGGSRSSFGGSSHSGGSRSSFGGGSHSGGGSRGGGHFGGRR